MINDSPPHYQGHRQRLRELFQTTEGVALQDDELLEMFLFTVYPRRDTKRLAKSLIQRFESLVKETAVRLSRSEIIYKFFLNLGNKLLIIAACNVHMTQLSNLELYS
jgi:DNA repair protein RadC